MRFLIALLTILGTFLVTTCLFVLVPEGNHLYLIGLIVGTVALVFSFVALLDPKL